MLDIHFEPGKRLKIQEVNIVKNPNSIIYQLRQENRINEQLEAMVNSLSVDELFRLKLELHTLSSGLAVFGNNLWKNAHKIIREALLRFVRTNFTNRELASQYLGLSVFSYRNHAERQKEADLKKQKDNLNEFEKTC